MALRFADDFDSYQTVDQNKWWTDTFSDIATGGRYQNCLYFVSGSSYAKKTLDAQATWVIGVAFKMDNLPTGGRLCSVYETSEGYTQMALGLDTGGHLVVQRGNGGTYTTLATGTDILSADTWYFLEFKVLIHASAGTYDVQLNGVAAGGLSASGIATRNSSSTVSSADQIRLVNPGAICWFDDLYVLDGTGAGPDNNFLGDVRVEALFVSGAGTTAQWTPSAGSNYECVDEDNTTGDFPNETDYVYSGTATQKDTYAMDNLAYTSGTVYGLIVAACAKKEDAGVPRQIATVVRSGASETDGATATLSAVSYSYFTTVHTTKPGGGVWTIADVNAMEAGAKLIA